MCPETFHLAGEKPPLTLLKAVLQRGRAGIEDVEQWLCG
jgi:hypothetical protein